MAKTKKQRSGRWLSVLGVLALLAAVLLLVGVLRSGEGVSVRQTGQEDTLALPINVRKAEDFLTDEYGHIQYVGALAGVDVSAHQGAIDWARVKAAGVDFAIIRAAYRGYGVGGLIEDECFRQNLEGARAAGVQVGLYFFSQAISEAEAEEEADYIVSLLGGEALDYPIYFDWEEVSEEGSRTRNMGTYEVGNYALAFCKRITEAGYAAGVYFNQRYGYTIMQLEQLADYSFWLAEYREAPSFLYDFDVWQYTGQGTVDGIETIVDLDLFFP